LNSQLKNRTIALAGIAQAIERVNQLATTGYLNTQDFETAVRSLFVQNPKDTLEPFGALTNLRTGLETLIKLIEGPRDSKPNRQLLGYALGILHLQKRLSNNPSMLNTLGNRIESSQHQLEHFGPTHENVVSNLADIYSQTISTFKFRIQVMGEYQYLQQARVANQVRVLLFGAIRAAILWRQLGGSRLQLLLQRKSILSTAKTLLSELPSIH